MPQQAARSGDAIADEPVDVGVVGVGEFGASLAIRDRHTRAVRIRAFADVDLAQALDRLLGAGIDRGEVEICDSRPAAAAALERGHRVLTPNASLLPDLPLDVLVDSTGNPEAAARTAEAAIASGRHVVMASKECDSVIGPLLYRKAKAAGVVYTPVDGDQPSLLMKLVAWSRRLGLRIVAAGKASEFDFVYDRRLRQVCSQGQVHVVPAFEATWRPAPDELVATVAERAGILAGLSRASAPDHCELGIVANATGLRIDRPRLHAPIARTQELPDLFCTRADGGLFDADGTVDSFNCLRRPDDVSFAGGVFVICDVGDDVSFSVLRAKGIPASRSGSRLLLYNPTHLLGVEAVESILAAARGESSVDDGYRPRYDLVGCAARDLSAGTVLAIADRHAHAMHDVEPLLVPATPLAAATSLPYYLALGCRLSRDVRAGQLLTAADVQSPTGAVLWRLRTEQDAMFLPA